MKRKRVLIVTLAAVVMITGMTVVFAADPGSDADPLISKSYIDNVLLPSIHNYINNAIAALSGGEQPIGQASNTFEVVTVHSGNRIICGKGTEFIVRMGNGSIIASERGGIADVTSGVDLGNGHTAPLNHLLIVPLDDGRGIQVGGGDMILMIKGGYTVL